MSTKWYVVYTKPNSEKKVSEILTRRKIENYSPVSDAAKTCRDSKKVTSFPLFDSYVFVKTTEQHHQDIKKINDVLNFLYWMGKPVVVKSVEIKAVKLFLNEYTDVTVEKTAIRPDNADVANYTSTEQQVPMITIRNKKASVYLSSLGYVMTAEVDTPNVRIISSEGAITDTNTKLISYLPKFLSSIIP